MSTQNEASTQLECNEEWEVYVDNKTYILTKGQMDVVRKATINGLRGVVNFEHFGFSLAHMSSYRRTRHEYLKIIGNIIEKISKDQYESLQTNLTSTNHRLYDKV